MQFSGQESHQNVVVCYHTLERSEYSLEIQSLDIVEKCFVLRHSPDIYSQSHLYVAWKIRWYGIYGKIVKTQYIDGNKYAVSKK